ncbi:hypothetical protein Micbo1qcDRAFT_171016 [Microdochium bolleyi]|uniref:Uncharacterized protein n=1 Tax=Microdochium bolleyi TaxID=196109 RepID=A0A136JJJ0_9PEZI|nr:hypothetical protein Micbo1qcDRAFT_171016 [Microdochium bolleyi]
MSCEAPGPARPANFHGLSAAFGQKRLYRGESNQSSQLTASSSSTSPSSSSSETFSPMTSLATSRAPRACQHFNAQSWIQPAQPAQCPLACNSPSPQPQVCHPSSLWSPLPFRQPSSDSHSNLTGLSPSKASCSKELERHNFEPFPLTLLEHASMSFNRPTWRTRLAFSSSDIRSYFPTINKPAASSVKRSPSPGATRQSPSKRRQSGPPNILGNTKSEIEANDIDSHPEGSDDSPDDDSHGLSGEARRSDGMPTLHQIRTTDIEIISISSNDEDNDEASRKCHSAGLAYSHAAS